MGFNVVIVSRNREKLEKTKKIILEESNGVDVVLVQADFSKSYEKGFFDEIEK